MLYGGLRIGMYDPVKRAFMGSGAGATDLPGLHIKIAAGMTTGALAILVASPTDLVKVRMQSEGKLAAGVPRRYPSAVGAYSIIVKCAPNSTTRCIILQTILFRCISVFISDFVP